MKKLYILFLAACVTSYTFSQTLLEENFDYGTTAGGLVALSGANWTVHNGTTTVGYATTSLSMTNYPSSGVGGSATLLGSNSEDVNRTFTNQTTGTIYFSTLVNVSAVSTTGNYFLHLGPSNIGTTFIARIGAKADSSGKILFGIATTASAPIYGSTPFDLNTTYLLVASFNIATGESKLYVLSTPAATEPTTPEATNTAAGTYSIGSVALRQSGNIPTVTVDGIRVGTTWNNTVVTTVLSTDENDINAFKLYPNPTSLGFVNIKSTSNAVINVSVFDVLGKQVLNETLKNNILNVSKLNSGIYVLKITQNNATVTKKLSIK